MGSDSNEFSSFLVADKKLTIEQPEKKVAVLSNFTITGLKSVLRVKAHEANIDLDVMEGAYNQYMQELLDENSVLYSFSPDIVFLTIDAAILGELHTTPYLLTEEQRKEIVENTWNQLKGALDQFMSKSDAKLVVHSLPIPTLSSRGILELKEHYGIRQAIADFNKQLENYSKENAQLLVFDTHSFFAEHGKHQLVDHKMYYLGDMHLSGPGLVLLADEYMRYVNALCGKTKKCLVLDLDNTLWGGIVGEDGVEHLKLGPDTQGRPFYEFQQKILELHKRGIILAIASKNNEEDALEVLRNHPHMVLKEDHFGAMQINWNDKATMIRQLAEDLNIGTDSMVFVDDDRVNRALVKDQLPEVVTVDLPEDPSEYVSTVEHLHVFDTFSLTDEDMKRGSSYVQERKRKELKSTTTNLKDFLKQLDVKVTLVDANEHTIPRIAQLTQKTNQFNLTTKRYQEEDIKKMAGSDDWLVVGCSVTDSYGDYGLCGVAIVRKEEVWEVDTFLLSCRVLGRQVETALMDHIVQQAMNNNKKMIAQFIPTKKNKPAESFLTDFGFENKGEEYVIEQYTPKNLDITVNT